MVRAGRPAACAPWAMRAQRASSAPDSTPSVGAKLETVLRTVLLKNSPRRNFLSVVAMRKVVEAVSTVRSALVKVEAVLVKVRPTSDTASTTKMALMRVEKISSVKRVRNLTRLDADVMDETNRMAAVQRPVQE